MTTNNNDDKFFRDLNLSVGPHVEFATFEDMCNLRSVGWYMGQAIHYAALVGQEEKLWYISLANEGGWIGAFWMEGANFTEALAQARS